MKYRRIKPGPLEKDNYVIYKALREIQNAIAKHPKKLIPLDKDHDAYKLSFNDRYVVLDKEGVIVLTASGYGYKTIKSATNAIKASTGGPLEKRNTSSSLQKKITHFQETKPEVFTKLTKQYRAYYVKSMDRYVIIDEFGTICANGNGYGFRTIATARLCLFLYIMGLVTFISVVKTYYFNHDIRKNVNKKLIKGERE